MMSRKDYQLIADAIRESKSIYYTDIGRPPVPNPDRMLRIIITEIAAALRRQNARFDSERFVRAIERE